MRNHKSTWILAALLGVVVALSSQGYGDGGGCIYEVDLGNCCPNLQSEQCWDSTFCTPTIRRADQKYKVEHGSFGFDDDTPTDNPPAVCDVDIYACQQEPQTGCYWLMTIYRLCENRQIVANEEEAEPCDP